MPCPWWALIRLSTNSVARDCHGCSSRRTISSPIRAELRQWTRRRSSPRRYSRTVTSSALPIAKARGRLSPDPVHAPPSGIGGSGHDARGDGEGRGAAEGAAELHQPERIADPHAHRPDLEAAADVGAHLVDRVPAPAVPDPVEHEARPGAEHVGDVVLQHQHAARRTALVGHREVDRRRLPGGHGLRADAAHQRQPVAAAAERGRGDQRQRGDQDADPGQRRLPQQDRAHDGRDARSEERPSADGQRRQGLTHGSPRGRARRR